MSKTYSIDTSTPTKDESPRLGDNRIRELKLAIAELMNEDHYMGAASPYNGAAAGQHKHVTFQATASGSDMDNGTVFAEDTTTRGELAYKNKSGSECVITSGTSVLISSGVMANNTPLRAVNAAGSALINLLKLSTGDVFELLTGTNVSGTFGVSGAVSVTGTIAATGAISCESGDASGEAVVLDQFNPIVMTDWDTWAVGTTAQYILTLPNGFKACFGFVKGTGGSSKLQVSDLSISLSDASFSGVFVAFTGLLETTLSATDASPPYVHALTTSLLTVGLYAPGSYEGLFYVVLGK